MPGQGLNINTISPAFRDKILMGLIGKNQSAFEAIFGVKNTRQLEGSVPFVPSKYSLGNSNDNAEIALDAVPEVADTEFGEMQFKIQKKFARRGKVHKAAVMAMEENSAEDITEITLQRAVISVAAAIDLSGKKYLTEITLNGSTINQTQAATAVWSDATNARPFTDLDALFDKVGNPDTLWLGLDRARELSALPAIKDKAANFSAVDGRIPVAGLASVLMSQYQFLQNVVIDDNWYNTANPQQNRATSRIFDNVVWAGVASHLTCVENTALRKSRVFLDEDTDTYYGEAVRYLTFGRGESALGCRLTGT